MARFFATSRASVESSAAAPSSSSSSSSRSSSNSSNGNNINTTKDACRATASSRGGSNATSTTTSGSRWSRRPRLRRQHAHDFESVPEKSIAVPAPALSRESLGSGYTEAPSSRGASETLSACSPTEAGLEDFLGDASDEDLSWLEADLSPSCAPPCEEQQELEVAEAAAGDSVALPEDEAGDDEAGVEELGLCRERHSAPLELRVEDFECGECIGKGSYSRVFLSTHVVSGTEWALKVVSKRKTFETRENLAHLREEKNISTKVQGSDFLVRTAGTFQNPRR